MISAAGKAIQVALCILNSPKPLGTDDGPMAEIAGYVLRIAKDCWVDHVFIT